MVEYLGHSGGIGVAETLEHGQASLEDVDAMCESKSSDNL